VASGAAGSSRSGIAADPAPRRSVLRALGEEPPSGLDGTVADHPEDLCRHGCHHSSEQRPNDVPAVHQSGHDHVAGRDAHNEHVERQREVMRVSLID
jgi:hypothetical protein